MRVSLRGRLILLVALAITPIAVMTVVSGVRERARAIDVARDNLERLTKLAAANEAQTLEGGHQILRDLAGAAELLDASAASNAAVQADGCSALMSDVLAKNKDYVNFGLIALNGDVRCSAVDATRAVNLGDRTHFRRAVAERRFIASEYLFGRVIRKHTVNLSYPVQRDGQVRAVLFAALDLAELDKFVLDVTLPPGSALWTADADGNVISRRPDAAAWFGKPVPDALRQALRRERRTPLVLTDADGVARLYAFAGVGGRATSDYTVMIGIPQDTIVAEATRNQLAATAGLLVAVTLALLAAWFGGDALIVRRIQALAGTANRIAGGSLASRTGMADGDDEIGKLARSLDGMAQSLQNKEAERDGAEAQLRAADRRKDEFLAMLAHELRNPLAPISAGAQILKLSHASNASVARTADIIARQVGHMTRLIDDLLDVSRVTRGLVQLDLQPLDLRHVLADAVEQVQPLYSGKGHRLELALPDGVALGVPGDHKRLVQVAANLLNNAAKYTPEGGHVRVTAAVENDTVRLSVGDDGIGMAPELVARVFELFAQGERTPDRSQGGLGLGLALVRTLVQLHGGSVAAHSAGLGKGSRFDVLLPRCALAHDAAEPAVAEAAGAGVALRCLVVDDNVDAATTLAVFLEAAGQHVAVAHRGDAALLLAREQSPQLCFLDIGLPDMDGNALAARLRALPQTAHARLVAVSGYGRREDRQHALASGFDEYFVKPLDTAKLVQLLAMLAREGEQGLAPTRAS